MKVFEAVIRVVLHQVGNGLMALLGGWSLMVAVGVAHGEWIRQLPTIGYWWAVLIVFLLQGSFATIDTVRGSSCD